MKAAALASLFAVLIPLTAIAGINAVVNQTTNWLLAGVIATPIAALLGVVGVALGAMARRR